MSKLIHVLRVVVFATVLNAPSSCDSDCEGDEVFNNVYKCSYYYDLLENALLNDPDNVFRLQQAFFPMTLNGDPPNEVGISVFVSVNEISSGSCRNDSCLSANGPSFSEAGEYSTLLEWKNPHPENKRVEKMLLSNAAMTSVFESVFLFSAASWPILHNDDKVYYYYYGDTVSCKIELQLDQLPCNPCRDGTYNTLARILTWAKAIARARGRPKKLEESDRGQFDGWWFYTYEYENLKLLSWKNPTFSLLLVGFVFLNVLVMLLMLKFVLDYYPNFVTTVNGKKVNGKTVNGETVNDDKVDSDTRHLYHSFYWGCALVLFILAMGLHVLDLGVYVKYLPLVVQPYYKYIRLLAIFCVVTKFVVMVVELLVCAYVCMRNTITLDIPFPKCTTVFCCNCTCCCSVQTLALWGQMVVVQHITAGLIPLCFIVVSQPAETLSILALCASTLFCTIIIVVHVFYLRQQTEQKRITSCIQIFAVICFIGFAVGSITVYIVYLVAGAEFSGLGGFLGSLSPSVILSAVGWYIKKKFLKTKAPADPTHPTTPNLANVLLSVMGWCLDTSADPNKPTTEPDEETPLVK